MNQPTEDFLQARGPACVGTPLAHESAHLHVSGQATYTDDIPEATGTLYAALGLSREAHARISAMDLTRVRAMPGIVAVLTAADVTGENNVGPVKHDDPILAAEQVQYLGQPVFVVVATSTRAAREAARLAQAADVVAYEPLAAILTPKAAFEAGSYVLEPMHMLRESAPGQLQSALASAPHHLSGEWELGGQEQFYLEGQVAYATPQEDDGMLVQCSTQHPSEMQHVVAHALGFHAHQVRVECRRLGGGFGGKESQSALFACAAALCARRTGHPVKLRVDRDDDFLITGRRHGYWYRYDVGYDDQGRILAADITMVGNAGFSADLSAAVMTRALCHFDNAYWLPEVAIHGYCGKTNTQSNTAFRGFGGPQGAIAIELIIERVATRLGIDPLEVRRRNFYARQGQTTPYGQAVEDNIIHELVDELVESSDYAARRAEINRFNAASPVLKRGIALTPVKFGISFNVPFLNQAGALVHVYTDGTVLVNHGGIEMGQGLNTKVAQVVAQELGVTFTQVRCTATDTSKVVNTSATAASTGSDLNGKAAQDAAGQIRERLTAFAARTYGVASSELRFAQGEVFAGARRLCLFSELTQAAYLARVQLWSDGFYATPGVHWDARTLTGHPFYYFAYGAAVSEVVIDTLTGESRTLRADVLYDAGRSLNPAIDLGQVEGGFIQGMGWLTTEELWWHPKTGKLMTHAPSTYKIPTANDLPPEFHVQLYGQDNPAQTIHRSKAVGEPPLLLPFSVFFAIRQAIASAADAPADPPLTAPATAEAVLHAVNAVCGPDAA